MKIRKNTNGFLWRGEKAIIHFTLLGTAHMKKHFYAYEVGIDEKVDKLKKYLPKNVNNIDKT